MRTGVFNLLWGVMVVLMVLRLGSTTGGAVNARVIRVVAAVKLGSFVLLMLNIATVRQWEFDRFVGSLHGLAYLATVVAAIPICNGKHRIWCVALAPGVGRLLASRMR